MYCSRGLLNNGPPGAPDPRRVDPGDPHRGRNVNSPKRNETLPSTRHNERDRLPVISACARVHDLVDLHRRRRRRSCRRSPAARSGCRPVGAEDAAAAVRDAVAADCGSVASTRLMCSRSTTQSRTHRSPHSITCFLASAPWPAGLSRRGEAVPFRVLPTWPSRTLSEKLSAANDFVARIRPGDQSRSYRAISL
jgi:hypothetical protein